MAASSRVGRPPFGQIVPGLLLALAISAPIAVAAGQQPPKSLGEIAREEAERRKAMAAKAKAYTKEDLPAHAQLPVPAAGSSSASAPAGTAKPGTPAAAGEKPTDEKPAAGGEKDEAWWRDRVSKARDGLRRSEMFAQALETRINSLNADFNGRDDPLQRAAIAEERTRAVAELQAVRTEIKSIQQQLTEIEDEARRANVPPGWVR